jgi:alpha-D-xyloside xylohydrolase
VTVTRTIDIPPLSGDKDYGGYLYTGQSNELWSYGKEAQKIMQKFVKIRLQLKPYLKKIAQEAHRTGVLMMRTVFYEFPQDAK